MMDGMTPQKTDGWQFWVDRGGTFTDVVARAPDGTLYTHKLLSENPEAYEDAALQGIRDLLGLADGAPMPAAAIDAWKWLSGVAERPPPQFEPQSPAAAVQAAIAAAGSPDWRRHEPIHTRALCPRALSGSSSTTSRYLARAALRSNRRRSISACPIAPRAANLSGSSSAARR